MLCIPSTGDPCYTASAGVSDAASGGVMDGALPWQQTQHEPRAGGVAQSFAHVLACQ